MGRGLLACVDVGKGGKCGQSAGRKRMGGRMRLRLQERDGEGKVTQVAGRTLSVPKLGGVW